jgi:hypothetical protein
MMEKTTRRNVLKVAGTAGVAAGLGVLIKPESGGLVSEALAAEEDHRHGGKPLAGPLSNATVTFGSWLTDPPFDRFAPDPNDLTRNHHQLTPNEAKIEVGGSVNFIIGGFHLIEIYDDGTQPEQINRNLLIISAGFPPLINDPNKRIYMGLDPRTMPPYVPPAPPTAFIQDRVETVQFAKRGIYLVICGVLPHFFNQTTMQFEMFGFVRVVGN